MTIAVQPEGSDQGASGLMIEGVLFPLLVPRLPLRLHAYLGDLELLSQSSKAGLTPRNYVALLGDSYAQGVGDWLLQADPDAPASYGSAHVIHDLSGRDVLTFGRAGAGSFESMVSEPFRRFGEVAGSPWYRLDPPSDAIVYFYEGNDLDDNLRTLRRRPDGSFVVAVVLHGRPWDEVLADLVDGVIAANGLTGAPAWQCRHVLQHACRVEGVAGPPVLHAA